MIPELLADLERCHDLPSIPAVAARAIALARDPGTDYRVVAATLEQDPAMAGKLLKRANSPRYGRGRTHSSVVSAVRLLGIRNSLTIALRFSLVDRLAARNKHSLDFVGFWQRALLAGVYARNLATHLGRVDAEDVFSAALLQDIGMMALDQVSPHLYQPIAGDSDYHNATHPVERAVAGINHAVVSAWLLAQWGLPKPLIRAAARSHCATRPDELGRSDQFERTVMLSGVMADMWLDPDRESKIDHVRALAVALLDLSARDVDRVIEMAASDTNETGGLFGIVLTDPDETKQLLDAAAGLLL